MNSYTPSNYCSWSKSATSNYEKKYYLFCGSNDEYRGGWEDFKGNFSTIEDAMYFLRREIEPDERKWFHVVDIITQNIVKEHPEGRMYGNE